MLDRVGELFIQMLGEGRTGVVGQNPDEHDGIVLDMWLGVVFFGEEFANVLGGYLSGDGTCDGGLDDDGEMEHFFT